MEMKQSKMAQYLAGTLDMSDQRNKNSLYIELAEKISYGNKDDISTALAVTEKVRELTGREPEYEPYVPGMPKRCLGQDIRAGYITPSEEAEKLHRDLTGQNLPGLEPPSEQEIACTDAEIGAKAAGFQTGHTVSGPERMLLEEEQSKSPRSAQNENGINSFDQEGKDMAFGPSKVIKGALTNNMEEVLEGLKETTSIGAGKDLKNSLEALSNPAGIAKYLIDGFKENSWLPRFTGLASGAVGLSKELNKENEKTPIPNVTKDEETKTKDLAGQIYEQLKLLTATPTQALETISKSYEQGLEGIKNIAETPKNNQESGGLVSQVFGEHQEMTKEAYLQQIATLTSPNNDEYKKMWNDLRDSLYPKDTQNQGAGELQGDKNEREKPFTETYESLNEGLKEDDLRFSPSAPSNVISKMLMEMTNEVLGIEDKEKNPLLSKEWLPEDKKVESKDDLKSFFDKKMEEGQLSALLLGQRVVNGIRDTMPNEIGASIVKDINQNEKIGEAVSGNYTKQWESVEKLFDTGASTKELNNQMSLSASSLPLTILEQSKAIIDKGLNLGQNLNNPEGEKSKNPSSGFGIEGGAAPQAPENQNQGKEKGEEGPLGAAFPSKESGGGYEALAGSIARGITYSVARKRGLNPKESGDMAEMAGKEAEDVTRIAANSKENVGKALEDVKTAKNTAAKGLKAATELIPNPAIGKAVAIGIAIADKASDFVIDMVNNNGNATSKLMDSVSAQAPAPEQKSSSGGSLDGAAIASAQSSRSGPTSNDFMTLDAFRESLQKDRKGLTKKLVPKEDLLASGAQTAINSIGSWGSGEIQKANHTPKVDEMHKMIDSPA